VLGTFRKFHEQTGKKATLVVEVVPKTEATDKAALACTSTNVCKSLASDGDACGAVVDVSALAVALSASKGLSIYRLESLPCFTNSMLCISIQLCLSQLARFIKPIPLLTRNHAN
jgi:hypothetical protein